MIYIDNTTDQQVVIIPVSGSDVRYEKEYYTKEQMNELLSDTKIATLSLVNDKLTAYPTNDDVQAAYYTKAQVRASDDAIQNNAQKYTDAAKEELNVSINQTWGYVDSMINVTSAQIEEINTKFSSYYTKNRTDMKLDSTLSSAKTYTDDTVAPINATVAGVAGQVSQVSTDVWLANARLDAVTEMVNGVSNDLTNYATNDALNANIAGVYGTISTLPSSDDLNNLYTEMAANQASTEAQIAQAYSDLYVNTSDFANVNDVNANIAALGGQVDFIQNNVDGAINGMYAQLAAMSAQMEAMSAQLAELEAKLQ